MNKRNILATTVAMLAMTSCAQHEKVLHECFPFTIGAAINVTMQSGGDSLSDSIVRKHYNSIVAEDCMKCENIHPEKDKFFWDEADAFVAYGEKNNMEIIGHCLIWHSQCAPWFAVGENDSLVTADELRERMREHIHTIVSRYKGRIKGWDVVNEMVEDDGSFRNSFFYQVLGEEYIYLALQYAHEADPDAMLFLNDYNMFKEGKRKAYLNIIKEAQRRGLRLDAIGMQCHYGMDFPEWQDFEASLKAFSESGVKVMFTEVDMNILSTIVQGANVSDKTEYDEKMNPYVDGVPADVDQMWNTRMATFFSIVEKYSGSVIRMTSWGVTDKDSWLNNWPMKGRTNYPLWFDRKGKMKPFLVKIMEEKQKK